MAAGLRIRSNFQRGTITNNPLLVGGTTINSAEFTTLPTVSSNHLILVLDPTASAGAPEIVEVTAHTAAATSATIARGAEGSTARQHAVGITWILSPTVNDYTEICTSSTRPTVGLYEAKRIYETDTNREYLYDGAAWVLAPTVFATNAVLLGSSAAAGAATTVMRSNDTIAAFDATNPTTSLVGDAAAVGTAAFAARRDHKHAREAANTANPPACRAFHNVAQSITTTGVEQTVAFNQELFDTDTMHDLVTNNSRITFNKAGLYLVTATLAFASNGTGLRNVHIRLNGTTPIAFDNKPAVNGDVTGFAISTLWKFAAADYVEMRALQTSGGALNINSASDYTPEFAAAWIGTG